MISMQTFQGHSPIGSNPKLRDSCEQCQRQVLDAEREISAFVIAVERTCGPVVAFRAAEYCIELAESISLPSDGGCPDWRKLTVMASSRLATDSPVNIDGRRETRSKDVE
jgi:hypothetical protein